MSIYQRGEIWWVYLTYPDGRRIRRSTGTASKNKALELHDQLRARFWDEKHLRQSAYTWNEAVARYIKETHGKADHERDKQKLRWLDPYLSNRKLSDINQDLIFYIADERRKTVTDTTVNRYLALVRCILRKTATWGWITAAPAIKLTPERPKRFRWLTQAEVAEILPQLPEYLQRLMIFALATGLRESNVTHLQWDQIDMHRHVAWVHPDQAKARRAIGVPLNDDAMGVLEAQKGADPIHVFTVKGKISNIKAWRVIAKSYSVRWHDLRHTWASWHVQSGTPLNVLQELGGWSTASMVQRYAHLAPEHLAQYANNCGVNVQGLWRTAPQTGGKTGIPISESLENTSAKG